MYQWVAWIVGITTATFVVLTCYQLWVKSCGEFGYPIGGQPDELLPTWQTPQSGADVMTTSVNDYPQFLGVGSRGAVEHVKLDPDWTAHPPQLLWRQPIGAGWSSFAAVNGFAVTMEQRGKQEQVTCYQVKTGQHYWTAAWEERFFLMGVGPRSTPTIVDGRVYALGAWGHLACLDGKTGDVIWQRELLSDLGIDWYIEHKSIPYGRCSSPFVVDSMVIVPGGGLKGQRASLIAYDTATGELRWRGGKQQISYSSPVLANLLDGQQILCVNEDTVSGHALDSGIELWSYPWPSNSNTDANVSQPVPLLPDRIFISKGYGQGAAVIRLVQPTAAAPIQVQTVWRNKKVLRTKFTNVVIWMNHAYGLSDGVLECVNLDTGESRWKKGPYGHGQIMRVGDLLLVLSDRGELTLVRLDPQTPNAVLGKIQVLNDKTWNNPTLYGRYLLVRNATESACYELTILP
jgi:outer membrane protein assembly factor BamB